MCWVGLNLWFKIVNTVIKLAYGIDCCRELHFPFIAFAICTSNNVTQAKLQQCNKNMHYFFTQFYINPPYVRKLQRNKLQDRCHKWSTRPGPPSLVSREHGFLFCFVLLAYGRTDGRTTYTKTIIPTGHDCGLAEWIKKSISLYSELLLFHWSCLLNACHIWMEDNYPRSSIKIRISWSASNILFLSWKATDIYT